MSDNNILILWLLTGLVFGWYFVATKACAQRISCPSIAGLLTIFFVLPMFGAFMLLLVIMGHIIEENTPDFLTRPICDFWRKK